MRDNHKIYEKYLNMQPVETNKKIDFTVKFESKKQKVAVILFGIALVLIFLGVSLQFLGYFSKKDYEKTDKTPKTKENTKYIDNINNTSELITINELAITHDSKSEEYEMTYILEINQDFDELCFKITLKVDGVSEDEIVIPDYLTDLHAGDTRELFYTKNVDLTKIKSAKVEITTKEDLRDNYGYDI